jgi:hypothetical protein
MRRYAVVCAFSLFGLLNGLGGGVLAKVKRHPAPRPRVENSPVSEPVRAQPTTPAAHVPPPAPAPRAATRTEAARDVVREESKIEFDDRMVQGQTASGAIYLFQRGESEFNSMVHAPTTFRERTLQKVYARPPEP